MVIASEEQNRRAHLLMVCCDGEGHFYPFREILYHLSSPQYASKVIVTVLNAKKKLEEIAEQKARGNYGTLDLRFAEYVMPNMGDETGRIGNVEKPGPAMFARLSENLFQPHKERLLREKDSADAPTCIISDMFYIFLQDLAEDLQIPWYPFVTGTAFYIYTLFTGPNPLLRSADPEVRKQSIPGLGFGRLFDSPPERQWSAEFFDKFCDRYERCKAMLINIVEEWDAPARSLPALRDYLKLKSKNAVNGSERQIPRVLPVGAMINVDGFAMTTAAHVNESNGVSQEHDCLTWLDRQTAKSVLYVAFGTVVNISPKAILELAHGLEESGVSFLWVVRIRPSEGVAAYLPPGFQERVGGRAFFETRFAPQPTILQHPAIAGFISHCGWNSCMESMCAGVPLITWPLAMDQPLNARFIVDVCKAGIGIKNEDQAYFSDVSRDEVTKAVEVLVARGEELRENALAYRRLAEAAMKEGGSSHAALHSFMQEITTSFPRR